MMVLRLILATLASIAWAAACGWLVPRVPEVLFFPIVVALLAGSFGLWYAIAVGVRRGA